MAKRNLKIRTVSIMQTDAVYPIDFPQNVAEFSLSARCGNEFKVAVSESAFGQDDYLTVRKNEIRTFGGLVLNAPLHLFLVCDTPGETIEIEYWE